MNTKDREEEDLKDNGENNYKTNQDSITDS